MDTIQGLPTLYRTMVRPHIFHLHLVCVSFRGLRPSLDGELHSRPSYTTGTVRPTYSVPSKRETTHLKSARLARLPVLDRDLAFALELALEIPVVLVLPVHRSPEIRKWSKDRINRTLVTCCT